MLSLVLKLASLVAKLSKHSHTFNDFQWLLELCCNILCVTNPLLINRHTNLASLKFSSLYVWLGPIKYLNQSP